MTILAKGRGAPRWVTEDWIVLAFASDASGNLPGGVHIDDVVPREIDLIP